MLRSACCTGFERVWNSLDLTGEVGRGVSACEQPSLSRRLRVGED